MKASITRGAPKQLDSVLRRTFYCPSCSTLQLSDRNQTPRKRRRTERYASTLSTTAVNGSRPIPERYQPLHTALSEVKVKASAHVNLSRLQLALQGLESEKPVTRIALLGLNVQDIARRIARLLLADALEDEQAWEQQILRHKGTQGILIRYGQPHDSSLPQRTSIPVLQIPSPILQRLNVELLISSINAEETNGNHVPAEAFLAPAIGVPTAFDGRQVTVNQPVHGSLVVAQGFDELIMAVELISATSFNAKHDRDAVVLVANLPNSNTQSQSRVLVSDVARAEKGLSAIRTSTAQAPVYGQEWNASGLPQLSEWFRQGSASYETGPIATPIYNLISSLLTAATSSLQDAALTAAQETRLGSLDPAARLRVEAAVDDFSRSAHQELQSGLTSAWSSRNWRKLSWYKLFWRVDDVGLIISDLVTNTWLPKTERAAYEISGRLTQLSINPVMTEPQIPQTEHKTAFEPETAQPTILDPTPPILATATTSPANAIVFPQLSTPILKVSSPSDKLTVELTPPPLPVPIASFISTSRSAYLNTQITNLTSTAQQLVFRTFSISGLSAGLSALTYISTIAPTLYEAGTIFAVGTVFALYRLQTGWQQATRAMEKGLFEEGREVIRKVVQRMRKLVETRAAQVEAKDPVEEKMYEDARVAVQRATDALDKLKAQGQVRATTSSES
ncbi:hypothetical protein H2198_001902 [Neophaeococcomyces mojaviensis]|uniref:Uncharacterized protein n=1 Tax=Neophaeococcomyces mojaviensis TaxID=3383035 RepID=A0ACC3AFN3_9EURO|nr:hypothetical protein H2198_001902 [Knufia sp. JES_112]